MTEEPRKPDILHRLRFYADHIDDVPAEELEAVLREAAGAWIAASKTVGGKGKKA